MEQNTDAGVPVAPMAENKQKSGNGLKIATAIACIVAVCGIGFGVYGMVQSSQKDNQISDLKVQVKKDDGTVTTIETPEIETSVNDGTTVTITDTVKVKGGPYIENDYFYVPKWGIKFKLSEDLTNYGYAVDQNSQNAQVIDSYIIGLTAISKDDYIEKPQANYYNDIFSCSIVKVGIVDDSVKMYYNNNPDAKFIAYNGTEFVINSSSQHNNCRGQIDLDPDGTYHTLDYYAPTDTVAERLKTILSNPEGI